jgi:hypothetical protein
MLTCETCGMSIVDIAEAKEAGEVHDDGTPAYLHFNAEHGFYTHRDHPACPASAHAG